MTYSAHAAATKAGIKYYFVTFSIHLALVYIFVVKWLVPTYHLPGVFSLLMLLAVIGEFIALLVPTTGGRMTLIHDISSYFMFVLLAPLSLMIAASPNFSTIVRTVSVLAAVYMFCIWPIFLFNKESKRQALILQTFYGGSFHLVLLLAVITK